MPRKCSTFSVAPIFPALLGILLLWTDTKQSLVSAAEPDAAESHPPNIVLCMADDQGWGDVGYYGTSAALTPNLDQMAAQGLQFDRFYAAAPVCSPTRGSVLTGRHPNRYGCFSWGHSLRPEEVTIAEALQEAGYVTGHFGKWHLGNTIAASDVSPASSGFDRWFSSPNFFDNNPLMCDNGQVVQTKGESSEVTMNAALEFMEKCVEHQTRFLAVIWFGSPHSPHFASEEDRQLFPKLSPALQQYYGEIHGIDRSMGRLRQELRRLNIADNTVVWYTSDNGPQGPLRRNLPGSAGGLRDRKGTVWEGGIRVPAIIEWPQKITSHQATNLPCGTVDILPTILNLAGVTQLPDVPLDGVDVLSMIGRKTPQRDKPLGFWSYPAQGSGMRSSEILAAQQQSEDKPEDTPNNRRIRDQRIADALSVLNQQGHVGHAAWIDGKWKLHRIQPAGGGRVRVELYDLTTDPAETKDLSTSEPDRIVSMTQQLEAWQQSVVSSLSGQDYKNNRSEKSLDTQ